ncbi:MAG: ribosomal protein S18-alanine N-acetyltransferase [Terracidiphilus sp.]
MNTTAEIEVRHMAAADLPRILEIAQKLKNVPRWPPRAWLAALNPVAAPRRIALIAAGSHDGTLYGFAVTSLLPPQAELETIAVNPEARRRGIGSRLIAAFVEELGRAEILEIFLEVRVSNRTAQAFYQALGFTQTGQRARYYIDPIEDAVLMSLELP